MSRNAVSTGARRIVLGLSMTCLLGPPAGADDGEWSLRFKPMYMSAFGHDPHVLTVHEGGSSSALELETDPTFAFRSELLYSGGPWGFGTDVSWYFTSQSTADRTAAGGVAYEIPGRTFVSTGAGEVLYYNLLSDTDLETWNASLYASRRMGAGDWRLRFGLKVGDFDNDYHARIGVEGEGGTQVDSSSNYALMYGATVGLTRDFELSNSRFETFFGLSVLVGEAELSNSYTDFTGPATAPEFGEVDSFRQSEDVTLPIAELRLDWSYRLNGVVSLGAGLDGAVWWDIPVPPGVIPGQGRDTLNESTLFYLGLVGIVGLDF